MSLEAFDIINTTFLHVPRKASQRYDFANAFVHKIEVKCQFSKLQNKKIILVNFHFI